MDNTMLEFQTSLSEIVRKRTIKECFILKKEEGVLPIKQAHSLQRNGRL